MRARASTVENAQAATPFVGDAWDLPIASEIQQNNRESFK
jgi:hypothetical protein